RLEAVPIVWAERAEGKRTGGGLYSWFLLPLFPAVSDEIDRALGLGRNLHKVLDRCEDLLESVIIRGRQLVDPLRKVAILHQGRSHLHERAHDVDAGLDRNLAAEDAGEHDRSMFGEHVRWVLDIPAFLQGCNLQP